MDLLIVGASARAAVWSARRAGLAPAAIDLYADADLRALAPTRRIAPEGFPDGLPEMAAALPPGPFLFTGGLENHPETVAAIARTRPLWGVAPADLAAVRDPFVLRDALRRAGLPCPEIRASPAGLPRDGSWLAKPCRSAGGRGIQPLWNVYTTGADAYFQERIAGRSLGAVFLAVRSGVTLVGVTEARLGAPGAPFGYAGSVGPVPMCTELRDGITALGRAIGAAFGLRGLFGVDLVERDGVPWPVEVNPRYTASVEVLERALGRSLLLDHRRAFSDELGPGTAPISRPPGRIVGKAILYAEAPGRFRGPLPRRPRAEPRLADLPDPGTTVVAGEPVVTVFATARSVTDCHQLLDRRVARARDFLVDWGNPFCADCVP